MHGKVALVTGASSGIGRDTARGFAREGAAVVVSARRPRQGNETAQMIAREGGKALFVRADVSQAADVRSMVSATLEIFGRLDYAVNNASIEGHLKPIAELAEQEWDEVLSINLKGTFLCMKYEARAMIEQGSGGAIVNVGSVNSFLGGREVSAYVSSKHGQLGLTRCASAELAPHNIRVNIMCPGVVDTPMHRRLRRTLGDEVYDDDLIPRVHLGRAARSEEIAANILFLCSDEASYITGAALTADGGFCATH
jgi:NAD(P)-dependent dehydrogenase (short-subunit alcohol dehydrogenase family)